MKKKFLLPALFMVFTYCLAAQDSTLLSCKVKDQYISFVRKDKTSNSIFLLLEDRNHRPIDTIKDMTFVPSDCKCNDSIATFYSDTRLSHPAAIFLTFDGKRWAYYDFYLNLPFPLVGNVMEDKIYEGYIYTLVSPTKIQSDLRIFRGTDGKNSKRLLELMEQYKLTYEILPNPDWKPDPSEPPYRRNHDRYKMKMVEKVAVPIRE